MGRVLKALGLLALFHLNNAAKLTCGAGPSYVNDYMDSGDCILDDPNDASKLFINENSAISKRDSNILPFTHYTVSHPLTHATSDLIHFKEEKLPLQAYTYYIPKLPLVTICSPQQCIQLSGISTFFFITPTTKLPRKQCPEDHFIHAYNGHTNDRIIGACISKNDPGIIGAVRIESAPTSFFYLSRELLTKYHIIDHRSSPPQELISDIITVHSISDTPFLILTRLRDYNRAYLSNTSPSESSPVLSVTGTFFSLKQRPERRYMVQTPSSLYSLLDDGKGGLSLEQENERFYHHPLSSDIPTRRIVLQIFPETFKLPDGAYYFSLNYHALYKEAYGYESRKVDRTITGAYSFMKSISYLTSDGVVSREDAISEYAVFGATYLYSIPTYYRNVGNKEWYEIFVAALKAADNENWDQLGQEAPLYDGYKIFPAKEAEGGLVWYLTKEEVEIAMSKGIANVVERVKDSLSPKINPSDKDSKDVVIKNKDVKVQDDKDEKGEKGGKEEKDSKKKWKSLGRVLFLAVVVIVVIVAFAKLTGKRSEDQNQPSTALLTSQQQYIV